MLTYFRKKIHLIIAVIILSITVPSCKDSIINIFPESEDMKLGTELSAQISTDASTYPVFTRDASVKQYIKTRIFDHILSAPEVKKRSVYAYDIEIIDDPNTLNAFALPGGKVYLYTGLLKYLDSEAALAGVIGHEIAHAERRHATQRLTEYYGVSLLLNLVLGKNPSELTQLVANLLTGAAFLANGRAQEDESDEYSIKYLQGTRYYPGGVKFFFEKMKADGLVSSSPNALKTFLSTHPDPISRIGTANTRLQNLNIPVRSYTSDDADFYKSEYEMNIRSKVQ